MSRIHIEFEGKQLTQSRFDEIEKFVLEYFHGIWSDIRESIYTLREKDKKLIKSEVCLAFIGADSLSRFREIVTTGEKDEKKNEDRFREWVDSYVLNDKNEAYRLNKKEIGLNSSDFWRLRNSLLHFYGLPASEPYIGFATMDEVSRREFKDHVNKNKNGKSYRIVNPYRLIEVILQGFLMQTEVLMEMIKGTNDMEKEMYVRGIVMCYEIIQTEGTVHIPYGPQKTA
ncbi:MAG: hypothetical protein Athens041674_97 [Parcubacteria group bacterium Athens0416_74]|nr:MAG: hypothetical protein Athens041674_97 [Parcubacteria group bacterium Athens0416_74]